MWRREGGEGREGRLDASHASASCIPHPETPGGGCHAVGGEGGVGATGRVEVTSGDMQRLLWQDVVLSCNVGADWVTCPSSVYTGSNLRVLHTAETLRTHCGKAAYMLEASYTQRHALVVHVLWGNSESLVVSCPSCL
jgi:hypothetical protein